MAATVPYVEGGSEMTLPSSFALKCYQGKKAPNIPPVAENNTELSYIFLNSNITHSES